MTTSTLTDRYVSAVVRGVPDRQRADLEQELRASLADDIDARLDAGADAKSAERDAIVELGDPIVLAARYAGRPLHLVGPELYADWRRLLTVLEFIIVPIVVATLVIVGAVKGDTFGGIVGGANNQITAPFASVLSGSENTASGFYSAILSGSNNQAIGWGATVSGGDLNTASGINSSVGGGSGLTATGIGQFLPSPPI